MNHSKNKWIIYSAPTPNHSYKYLVESVSFNKQDHHETSRQDGIPLVTDTPEKSRYLDKLEKRQEKAFKKMIKKLDRDIEFHGVKHSSQWKELGKETIKSCSNDREATSKKKKSNNFDEKIVNDNLTHCTSNSYSTITTSSPPSSSSSLPTTTSSLPSVKLLKKSKNYINLSNNEIMNKEDARNSFNDMRRGRRRVKKKSAKSPTKRRKISSKQNHDNHENDQSDVDNNRNSNKDESNSDDDSKSGDDSSDSSSSSSSDDDENEKKLKQVIVTSEQIHEYRSKSISRLMQNYSKNCNPTSQ